MVTPVSGTPGSASPASTTQTTTPPQLATTPSDTISAGGEGGGGAQGTSPDVGSSSGSIASDLSGLQTDLAQFSSTMQALAGATTPSAAAALMANALSVFTEMQIHIATAQQDFARQFSQSLKQDSDYNIENANALAASVNLISQALQEMPALQATIAQLSKVQVALQWTITGLAILSAALYIAAAVCTALGVTAPIAAGLTAAATVIDTIIAAASAALGAIQVTIGAKELQLSKDMEDLANMRARYSSISAESTKYQNIIQKMTIDLQDLMKKILEEEKIAADAITEMSSAIASATTRA